MSEAVCIRDLSFSYRKDDLLFNKINLDINKGEKWAIIGPNASGKSTLVYLILGLLEPQSGSVKVFGKGPAELKNVFGYVPQKLQIPEGFPLTTQQFIMTGLVSSQKLFGGFSKKEKKQATEIMEVFDLTVSADKPVQSLSGGNFQKALLARAMINHPEILVLDEAFSNIDPRRENELLDRLKNISPDLTILLVTHDIGMVSKSIEKVACLNKNLVVHRTEALTDDVLKDVFGGQVRAISHKHTEKVEHDH